MSKLSFDQKTLNSQDLALYEEMVAKRKKMGAPFDGPYQVLMNHPQLCEKIEALGYYLKFEGHLPRDVYQFVVLAVAKATRASFEWEDHLPHALSAGIPQEVIDLLKNTPLETTSFPHPYKLAAQLLSYVLHWKSIPDDLQKACIQTYLLQGFIEIVTLSGFYQMMSAINQGFDVQK